MDAQELGCTLPRRISSRQQSFVAARAQRVAAQSRIVHASVMLRGPVLVLLAVLGCSRATPVGPAPEAPTAAPPAKVAQGSYKLVVSTMHEMSCSQSFQSNSELATYELSIAADGAATLAIKIRKSSVFGSSSAKFSGGPTTKDESIHSTRYVGIATIVAGVTQFEGKEEKTSAKAKLSCKPTSLEVTDGDSKLHLDALACAGLPLNEDATSYFKGPAPLAVGTGVLLAVHDYGHGTAHTTLRKGF